VCVFRGDLLSRWWDLLSSYCHTRHRTPAFIGIYAMPGADLSYFAQFFRSLKNGLKNQSRSPQNLQ
jgi:hypothetical protein